MNDRFDTIAFIPDKDPESSYTTADTSTLSLLSDFQTGIDEILLYDISASELATAFDERTSENGNTVIDFGENGSITLIGVDSSELSLGDFQIMTEAEYTDLLSEFGL